MPLVYISSTFRDLRPYREAAARAARAFECETLAMEDYVARDERPLDKCLADVRRSDIYVGIFARRYGFRPPGQQKSITELEYEAAEKKTRLIFFLDEEAKWDAAFTDTGDDARAQKSFLERVQKLHLGMSFTSPDHLEAKVSQALGNFLTARREAVPSLLPYLSDRSDQTDQLAVALDMKKREAPRRPFIVLVHGDEVEAHSMFVDRLRRRIVPKLLGSGPENPLPKALEIPWSDAGGDLARRIGRLHSRMMDEVAGRHGAVDVEELATAISRIQGPVMITTSILSAEWQSNEGELIRAWLEWWGSWPDLPSRQLLMVVISIRYRHLSDGFLSTLKSRRDRDLNRKAARVVEGLDLSSIDGIAGVTLDRLEGVKESHIRSWFDTYVKQFCLDYPNTVPNATLLEERMMPKIRDFFRDAEQVDGEGRVPMETIAKTLRLMLEESLIEGGT